MASVLDSSMTAVWPIDELRPRRAHRKSRKGCKTCKIRKVKCDEQQPICGGCARRFRGMKSCEYELFVESSEGSFQSFPAAPLPVTSHEKWKVQHSLTMHPNGSTSSDGSRLLELRLMHHYTTSTCGQLPEGNSSKGKYMWSMDIPRLAFQSDLVLSALLGISALHHAALTPADLGLSRAAEIYFDKAVTSHRQALSNADRGSAESLLATAILICHHAWLSAHTSVPGQHYEIPLQTYHMARGIQTLFDQMWPWLAGSAYLWYVERLPLEDVEHVASGGSFWTSGQEDLDLLSRTFEHPEVLKRDKCVYEATAMELKSLYLAIDIQDSQPGIQRRVATMPLKIPKRFLNLAEKKDPRALALLARNIALLNMTPHVWWLHGASSSQSVAETAITGISEMLPIEWKWAMKWPLRVISGEFSQE
ncbi:hypothetical protein DL98DRAFT_583788 [Cadophora sp. DSE1049]|nr:hypothetical protein DL98DRAFT_583788 [Cadophora sp. DSE1049]